MNKAKKILIRSWHKRRTRPSKKSFQKKIKRNWEARRNDERKIQKRE